MKKQLKKVCCLALAGMMLLSLLAGCKPDSAENSDSVEPTPSAPPSQQVSAGELEELGSGDVKWSEEKTAEGWMKVTNQGGATLGYSPDSGVKLLQSDGYAFKDMNRNGKLDPYEDGRLDADTRAADLAGQVAWDQIPGLLLLSTKGGRSTNFSDDMKESISAGVRTFDGSVSDVNDSVSYTNTVQAYVEALDLAIPVDFHAETGAMMSVKLGTSWPDTLGLGATFEPEMARNAGEALSAVYRAAGITTVNSPQIDLITEPRWSRSAGSYTEDPQLGSDMAKAFVSGLQSTYDENGGDQGWGAGSVNATLKHFPGNGTAEAGREGHNDYGKYNVYPGDNFYTHLLPFQAAMDLDSATSSAAGVMPDYGIGIDDSGDPLGGEKVSSAYSSYKITEVLREELGFDGMVVTDYDIVDARPWGTEDLSETERALMIFEAGVDKIGSYANVDTLREAVQMYVDEHGQEEAETRFRDSARRVVRNMIQIGQMDNPYISADSLNTAIKNEAYEDNAYEAHLKSLVMVKNSGSLIGDNGGEKPTVYIPMVYSEGRSDMFSLMMFGPQPASWAMPINANTASKYFNVVTDRVADALTGEPDEDGKPTVSRDDIIRASAEEIAACDFTLVVINSPSNSGGGYDKETGEYLPISLQYGNYVANSPYVRTQSLGGDTITIEQTDVYGTQTVKSSENRSYYGNAARVSNADELDKITYANSVSENVVVLVKASGSMIVSEFESSVDAILFDFGGASDEAVCEVVSGSYEPSGLLPLQMPANMETVEAQYEDVPRDMECHVDSDGNTYDFAFGLNWSGVIQDARTEKYDVPPLEG